MVAPSPGLRSTVRRGLPVQAMRRMPGDSLARDKVRSTGSHTSGHCSELPGSPADRADRQPSATRDAAGGPVTESSAADVSLVPRFGTTAAAQVTPVADRVLADVREHTATLAAATSTGSAHDALAVGDLSTFKRDGWAVPKRRFRVSAGAPRSESATLRHQGGER